MKTPGFIHKIIDWLKRIVLPGFDGVSIYEILLFFFKGLYQGALTMRASAVAFNFFLALFPFVLFLFTVIPYIPIDGFQEMLFSTLQDILPVSTFETVKETAEDIIMRPHGGLLSVGFVMALYFSTSGVSSLIGAFNQTIHHLESRSYLKQQLVSLILVLILSGLVIVGTGLLISGNAIVHYLSDWLDIRSGFEIFFIQFTRFIIVLILFFFSISFLYYLGPSSTHKFRFISAGSTLSTLLIILLSLGFNYYISNFSKYNKLYGSIGTLIIVMLWIYLVALVIIIGFELNASIKVLQRKSPKKMETREQQ